MEEVNKNKITVDLAKQHVLDNKDSDILKNDILKLIGIIEKRNVGDLVKQIQFELNKGLALWSDSTACLMKIKKAIVKVYEK